MSGTLSWLRRNSSPLSVKTCLNRWKRFLLSQQKSINARSLTDAKTVSQSTVSSWIRKRVLSSAKCVASFKNPASSTSPWNQGLWPQSLVKAMLTQNESRWSLDSAMARTRYRTLRLLAQKPRWNNFGPMLPTGSLISLAIPSLAAGGLRSLLPFWISSMVTLSSRPSIT